MVRSNVIFLQSLLPNPAFLQTTLTHNLCPDWHYCSSKKTPDLSLKNFIDPPETTTNPLKASPPATIGRNRAPNEPSCSQFVCMWSADQRAQTPSVVHQQLFLINPGDPGLLATSPQLVLLCLHTLISSVSVQNVPRMVISESVCPSVPSFIFSSLCHKSQRSSWNR